LQTGGKDEEISPFTAIRALLTGQGVSDLSSRLNMYFVDYGLMSLFVQVRSGRGERRLRREVNESMIDHIIVFLFLNNDLLQTGKLLGKQTTTPW
jgi:hypothetical protein